MKEINETILGCVVIAIIGLVMIMLTHLFYDHYEKVLQQRALLNNQKCSND